MTDDRAKITSVPLARKLGLPPAPARLVLVDAPPNWNPDGLAGYSLRRERAGKGRGEAAACIIGFVRSSGDLPRLLEVSAERIFPDGALWVTWPRRAGGHVSDVTDNLVRELALPLGIVDVKVAALDEDWSGLRFVWRRELRAQAR